jgi:hypothetical protein
MALKKEKTKRGVFLVELGSTKSREPDSETIEEYYIRTIPGSLKAEQTFNLCLDYYRSNGYKESELRLDRAVIKFGRRKS